MLIPFHPSCSHSHNIIPWTKIINALIGKFFFYNGYVQSEHHAMIIKETKSATINIFVKKSFLKMVFVKVKLSYVFTINLFTIAENCMDK